jgi:hypothetical protein
MFYKTLKDQVFILNLVVAPWGSFNRLSTFISLYFARDDEGWVGFSHESSLETILQDYAAFLLKVLRNRHIPRNPLSQRESLVSSDCHR